MAGCAPSVPTVGDGVLDVPASDTRKGIGCAGTWVCAVGDGVLDVPAWDARKGNRLRGSVGLRRRGGACPSRCPDDSAEPGDEAKTDESAVGAAISRPFCRSRTRVTALRKRPVPTVGDGVLDVPCWFCTAP